jgi:hypothetical protein
MRDQSKPTMNIGMTPNQSIAFAFIALLLSATGSPAAAQDTQPPRAPTQSAQASVSGVGPRWQLRAQITFVLPE